MSSMMTKLKFVALIACSAAEIAVARDLIWVGGAEGADAKKWDLSTLNWRVAGDETMTPVAFESGDNVLFDDTAQSFYVAMEKVDAVNTYQFDIGNVVFSNDVNNYSWKSFTDTWTEARGHMGTIDKWGADTPDAEGSYFRRFAAKAPLDDMAQIWYSVGEAAGGNP